MKKGGGHMAPPFDVTRGCVRPLCRRLPNGQSAAGAAAGHQRQQIRQGQGHAAGGRFPIRAGEVDENGIKGAKTRPSTLCKKSKSQDLLKRSSRETPITQAAKLKLVTHA